MCQGVKNLLIYQKILRSFFIDKKSLFEVASLELFQNLTTVTLKNKAGSK